MPSKILVSGANGYLAFDIIYHALTLGYSVRGTVRRQEQAQSLINHPALANWKNLFEVVVVSDMEKEGAFVEAMRDCQYAVHTATPVLKDADDFVSEVINPSINGTIRFLEAAKAAQPNLKTVVLMSSGSAILDMRSIRQPTICRDHGPYTENDIYEAATSPYPDKMDAYCNSKAAATNASKRWVVEKQPPFQVIHLMPSFVLGRDLRARKKDDLLLSTNGLLYGPLLGSSNPEHVPATAVDIEDVSRITVECLTEKVRGHQDFLLSTDGGRWEQTFDIVRDKFPSSVDIGIFNLSGSQPTTPYVEFDSSKARRAFGNFTPFESLVEKTVRKFIEFAMLETSCLSR